MGSHDPINLLDLCHECHHSITIREPGTDRFQTFSWQQEGETEADWKAQMEEVQEDLDNRGGPE